MNCPLRSAAFASLFASLIVFSAAADPDAARVRVIHASPDAPAVDVLANDALAVFTSVQFGDTTKYAEVPADVYDIKVVPAGAGPDAAVIQADLNLFYGTDYTVVAVNTLDSIEPIVLVDDNTKTDPAQARMRFLHAVPDAPAVDIKVMDGPYLFQDIEFKELGDYVTVPRNEYGIEVRVAGTDTVVLELPGVVFQGGGVYTILATGQLADGTLNAMLARDAQTQRAIVTRQPPLLQRPILAGDLREARSFAR